MKNNVIKGRDGLSFLNLKESPKAKVASKDSTLENQINKGMQNAIHEYLSKTWGDYYFEIESDIFKVDKVKNDGEVVETKSDTPTRIKEYRIVLPTNNGTQVKGQKIGRCFRLGKAQTYLQGVKTEACLYYTKSGKTYYYDDKGNIKSEKA